MRHLVFSALGILALAAGCKDLPPQPSAQAESEPAAAQGAGPSGVTSGDASSICVAYRKQLAASRAALAAAPKNKSLQETVKTFEDIILDACN